MFILNNGTSIEVNNDGTFKIAGKVYHDDERQHLKGIEDKLKLFTDVNHAVNYDDIPKRLREKLNKSLNTVFVRLDENKDESVIAINKLRDFGFLKEDYERIKKVSEDVNVIAYQMGLGSFELAYEKFKEKESLETGKDAADFIERYSREDLDNFKFFEDQLKKMGVAPDRIVKEHNDLAYMKQSIEHFKTFPKEERADKFVEDYKERGLSNFRHFSEALSAFGLENDEIFSRYSAVDSKSTSEKLSEFYNEIQKNKVIPEREKIAKFVNSYKERGLNDFNFFSETLQDFGMTSQKDILQEFNDSIDSSFKLSTKEFAIISVAKRSFMELQEQIIKDAIDSGLEVPSNLSRFVSPSDKIKDETINPQKIKMIDNFDFSKNQVGFKGDGFEENGQLTDASKALIQKNIDLQIKVLNIDTDQSVGIVNLQLIKNNGFSFDKMKDWALYSGDNDIINPQKAMSVAFTGLKQCNKLLECGILQTSDNKNFTFTTPRAREILFENPEASYNELADMMIKDHDITFNNADRPLNKALFDEEKRAFTEFLDAQYQSYYLPQGLDMEAFATEMMAEESQESQRFRDFYPELKRGTTFEDLAREYAEDDKFDFTRTPTIDFQAKETKAEIDKVWAVSQKENKENSSDISQMSFINISAVKFDGVSLRSLMSWKQSRVGSGLDEATVQGFVEASIKQAEKLVEKGLMVKNENNYSFKDDYSKEIVLKNFDKDLATLAKLDRGEKILKVKEVAAQLPEATSSGAAEKLLARLDDFKYSWPLSGDSKFKSLMAGVEFDLASDFKKLYMSDNTFKDKIDEMLPKIDDPTGLKNTFFDNLFDEMDVESKQNIESILSGHQSTNQKELEI